MRVSIVGPPWAYWRDPLRIQPLYEMGFATLIEDRCAREDVAVDLVDLRGVPREERVPAIMDRDLYLYWIMKSGDHNDVRAVVDALRARYPNAKHVAGGTHVSITPETRAACRDTFDAIIVGPGEESLLAILRDVRQGALQPIYETEFGDVRYGDYSWPRRHYLPEDTIVSAPDLFGQERLGVRGTTVQFSRGCPFSCKFCVYNWPNALQMRSAASMAEEIEYLKRVYRVSGLSLRDEICIPVSRKVAVPFLETLGKAGVIWRGQTVVRSDREMIALAAQSGCVELAFGVESASQQVIDINAKSKGQTIEDIRDTIGFCKQHGIRVKVCLIFGLPGEPQDIVDITKRFLAETEPDAVSLSAFCPFPGSPIAKDPAYYGIRLLDHDWSQYSHLLYRYEDDEALDGLPFEYEPVNRWGKTFTRREILDNILTTQHWIRERDMLA
jgi:radical SAM superfamily enzyme YgiQ (UPF0313 family)